MPIIFQTYLYFNILQSTTLLIQYRKEKTHKRSLHLIEDNPLEDQGCLGVTRILMFQSPSLLPEIEFSQAGKKGRIQIHRQEIPEVLGVLCGKRV